MIIVMVLYEQIGRAVETLTASSYHAIDPGMSRINVNAVPLYREDIPPDRYTCTAQSVIPLYFGVPEAWV